MTDDVTLQILRDADPLRGRDADLRPDSPMGARVRAAAMAAPAATSTPKAPAPRRSARVALAGMAACAAAAAGAVGLNGGGGSAPDARAELVQAAERTAAYTSGRISWRMTFDDPRSIYDVDALNDVRFQGSDSTVHAVTKEHGLGGDPDLSIHESDYRLVGGRAYLRSGEGPWKPVPSPKGDEASAAGQMKATLEAADALAALARKAPGVERTAGDGEETFRAAVDGDTIDGAIGAIWEQAGSGVRVVVTVGDDGVVRRATLEKGPQRTEIAFSDMGRPQGITAP